MLTHLESPIFRFLSQMIVEIQIQRYWKILQGNSQSVAAGKI